MDKKTITTYQKAGHIAKEVRTFAKQFVKEGMTLVSIADTIHKKIEELGAAPAFPVNLSIDAIAAHYHPATDDMTKASGLLKVDIGVHIDGFIADTAVSIDLTPDKRHTKLIATTEKALEQAMKLLSKNPSLHEIGEEIKKTIVTAGFSPIINLSGHSIEPYEIHAGITIPNYGNNNMQQLKEGVYAIEPFATYGEGKIYEGRTSTIYSIVKNKNTRSPTARKILEYVWKKNQRLPFSSREIVEKFGVISQFALRELENNGVIQAHAPLVEQSHKAVAQAEHTFIKLDDGSIIVTTA